MGPLPRFVFLLVLSSSYVLAGDWSGTLVDSACYSEIEKNVNPTDPLTNVDRDVHSELRYCRPTARTRTFALVEPYGPVLEFDSTGDSKAAALIQHAGKEPVYRAVVSGQLHGDKVTVEAISLAE